MNVFWLHDDPIESARMHCDQHVVKMLVEYAQMMSTAHRIIDGTEIIRRSKTGRRMKYWVHPSQEMETLLYKPTHANHPSNVWLRKSAENYQWLFDVFDELGKIYEATSGRQHATIVKLLTALKEPPNKQYFIGQTPLPKCMPDEYHVDSITESYRNFYRQDKSRFATFKRNGVPDWWDD